MDAAAARNTGVWTRLGGRLGRHTLVYASSRVVTMVLGLVSLAVLTRLLAPAEFGQLAVALSIAAIMAILCTWGFLQGTFAVVYSGGDDDESGVVVDEAEATEGDRRVALTTGLLCIVMLATAVAAVGIVWAPVLTGPLTGNANGAGTLRCAFLAGAFGAVHRLVHNIPRMERRPGAFVFLTLLRPILTVAASIAFVAAGWGVTGAVAGVLVGNIAVTAVGLVLCRRSFALGFSRREAKRIDRAGRRILPVIVAMMILTNSDAWILSAFADDRSVGIYRVATRAAAFLGYFAGALIMAWGPLTRTAGYQAMKEQVGQGRVAGLMLSYFIMASLWVLLGVALGADLLVRIAAPEYADAASIVPLAALAFLTYGVFVVLYRTTALPHRTLWITFWALTSAAALVSSMLVLAPAFGGRGAAVATALGPAVGAVGVFLTQRRGEAPLVMPWPRTLGAVGLAIVVYAAGRAAETLAQPYASIGVVAALGAFPVMLVVLRIIPDRHIAPLREVLRGLVRRRRRRGPLVERLLDATPDDRRLLRALTSDDVAPDELARLRGEPVQRTLAAAATAVARIERQPLAERLAADVGAYLFTTDAIALVDARGRRLIADGMSATDLDHLEGSADALRAVHPAAWDRAAAPRPATTAPLQPELLAPGMQRGVVLVTKTEPGSDSRVAAHAAGLARHGVRVSILGIGRRPAVGSPDASVTVLDAVPFRLRRLRATPLRGILVALGVRVAARHRPPQLVIACGPRALRGARRLARISGAPLLVDLDHGPLPARARTALRGATLLAGDAATARAARRRAGTDALAPVVRDVPRLPPASRTSGSLRRRYDDPERLALVDCEGLTRAEAEAIVEAVAAVPGLHVVFVGAHQRDLSAPIGLRADMRGGWDRVHLLRSVPAARMRAFAADADAFLCGAGQRGLPLGLFCALESGCPVIVARGSEAAAALVDDGAGMADFGDRDALVAALAMIAPGPAGPRAPRRHGLTEISRAALLRGVVERALASAPQPALPDGGRRSARRRRLGAAAAGAARRPRGTLRVLRGRRRGRARVATAPAAATRRVPDPTRRTLAYAAALRSAGRDDEARAAYRAVLDDHDVRQPAFTAAAVSLARLDDRDAARSALGAMQAAGDRSPAHRARTGEVAAALGELTLAVRAIDEALASGTPSRVVLRSAGRVLDQAGEPARALACARASADAPRVRRLAGLMQAYDAQWRPTLPWRPVSGPRGLRVLNLLETSLPHAHAGFVHRARTVLAAQRRAGFEPVAATRLGFPANRRVQDFALVELVDGVVHHRFAVPGLQHYTAVPADQLLQHGAQLLAPLARQIAPALVTASTPHLNGLVGLALCDALDVPFVYDVRGFPEMTWGVRAGGRDREAYAQRRASETRCMLEADAVITLSETMRREIVRRGVDPGRVHVVPHAVDVERLRPAERDPELARSLDVAGRTVVGYLGSILDYEGLEVLLEGLVIARRQCPELVGLVVGDGAATGATLAAAKRLGVAEHVRFTGRVPPSAAAAHYALFDIACVPRLDHEVCRNVTALKPFEIMAMGCCMLVSDVDALVEAVTSTRTGRSFRAGDAHDCAAVLVELAFDPEQRAALGRAARVHVAEHHQLDVVCAAMGSALHAALAVHADRTAPRSPGRTRDAVYV